MIDFVDKRIDLRISYICSPPTLEPVEPAALLGADNGYSYAKTPGCTYSDAFIDPKPGRVDIQDVSGSAFSK